MAFVTIRMKGAAGFTRQALEQDRVVLGRSSSCGLSLPHNSISREHCVFVRDGERWFIEDLGSSNGTWVGSARMDSLGRRELVERNVVKAGKARITFHHGSYDANAAVIDIPSEDDGDNEPQAPSHLRGIDDPPEAIPCPACHGWMSIAHHLAGDRQTCPRCGHAVIVPELVTAIAS